MRIGRRRGISLLFALLIWGVSAVLFLAQEAAIQVESVTVGPNQTTTLDITVSNLPAPGVNDVQGQLRYDPAVMRVNSLDTLSGFTLFASKIDNNAGRVEFALAMVGGSPIRQGGLLRLKVQAVGQAGQQTSLELRLDVFRDPDGNDLFPPAELPNHIQNGTFTISGGGGPGPIGGVSIHVFPNPARSRATFRYELPQGTTQARLWVFMISGALAYSQALDVNAGEFVWDLRDQAGRALPPGAYYYRVSALTPGGVRLSPVGRLVIQR